jgi:hypothetical protein
VLARVGSRTLTADEFIEVARGNESQYPGPPDSAKALLLGDMVRRALVLNDAERLGMYREPAVAAAREQFEREEIQQALYRQLVPAEPPVSRGEIERLYAWRDSSAHVQAVLCATRGAADAAAAEIARGARFEEIADRYGSSGALPPGGDLGYLTPGSLVPALDRHLREAPPGSVIGPVESPGEGWFILRILARRKRDQRPLEFQQLILRDMLRQRKVAASRVRARQSLRDAYDLRLEPGGSQAAFAYFNRGMGDPGYNLAAPTPAESAIVLARYQGGGAAGVYTFGDAMVDLTDYSRERPNPSMLPSLERWIESQAIRRLTLIEARRRRLHEEPEVIARVARRVDNQVLDSYYDVEIAHGGEATLEDMREAYERNRGSYQRLGGVELLLVTLPDSASAAALIAHAGHAPTLHEAVAMAAPGSSVTAESVRFPGAPERWKEYETRFLEMSPHECMGPEPVAGGWRVAQLVSKQQETLPLEALTPETVQSLRQQADEIFRDRMFQRKTEALRLELKPKTHPERLRDLPWPVAPPT